jgi:hypothetical protein
VEYFCDGPALLNNLPISSRDLRLRLSQVLVEHLGPWGENTTRQRGENAAAGSALRVADDGGATSASRSQGADRNLAGALRTSGISTIRRSRMATLCMYSRVRGNGNPRLGGGELAAEQFDQQID